MLIDLYAVSEANEGVNTDVPEEDGPPLVEAVLIGLVLKLL